MKKLCKDCQWCVIPYGQAVDFARCVAPQNLEDSTGFNVPRITYCTTQRSYGGLEAWALDVCGRSGRWYKAKVKTGKAGLPDFLLRKSQA